MSTSTDRNYVADSVRSGTRRAAVVIDTRTNDIAHWTQNMREARRMADWLNGTHTFDGRLLAVQA